MENGWFCKSRDIRWIKMTVPIIFLIFIVYAVLCQVQLRYTASLSDYVIWAVIAVISGAVLCGLGYSNLKVAFCFTAAGIIAGIAFMSYVFAHAAEHPGITGLISGIELEVILFIVGINLQMLERLHERRR